MTALVALRDWAACLEITLPDRFVSSGSVSTSMTAYSRLSVPLDRQILQIYWRKVFWDGVTGRIRLPCLLSICAFLIRIRWSALPVWVFRFDENLHNWVREGGEYLGQGLWFLDTLKIVMHRHFLVWVSTSMMMVSMEIRSEPRAWVMLFQSPYAMGPTDFD